MKRQIRPAHFFFLKGEIFSLSVICFFLETKEREPRSERALQTNGPGLHFLFSQESEGKDGHSANK